MGKRSLVIERIIGHISFEISQLSFGLGSSEFGFWFFDL